MSSSVACDGGSRDELRGRDEKSSYRETLRGWVHDWAGIVTQHLQG